MIPSRLDIRESTRNPRFVTLATICLFDSVSVWEAKRESWKLDSRCSGVLH